MTDTTFQAPPPDQKRIPGPVIFVAIMDFLSVTFLGILSLIFAVSLAFGNVLGLYDAVSKEMSRHAPTANYSYGLTFLFATILIICLLFVLFFVLLGIGLLKGKKAAWYIQVVLCTIGLFVYPMGTALNGVILFLFFRQPLRDFFKV